jgi:phage terminase large subunit-like protein
MVFVSRLIPHYDPWADAGDCRFDYRPARRAIGFFHDHLQFIEGERARTPFDPEPWQAAIVANTFGWLKPNGFRRYKEVLIFVPAKNGKSPLAAGIALYLLLCDFEPGAQIYCAAADGIQAGLVYRHAAGMVTANPDLDEETGGPCEVFRGLHSIQVTSTNSVFRVLSKEADTKHGLNAHGIIVDEVHAHKSRDLIDVLKTRTSSRRQPLIIYITTSDYERPSICNELHKLGSNVRSGVVKMPNFLPVIYEAAKDDDWTSPDVWAKANPNLGVSVRVEALQDDCDRAKQSPGYQSMFLRVNLNIRTNAAVSWLPANRWDPCVGWVLDVATGLRRPLHWKELRERMKGRVCYGGLDLASKTDLASFALWFPEDRVLLVWCWIPRDSAARREKDDRVPYVAWAREEALLMTGEGPEEFAIDYRTIKRDIVRLCEEYDVREIGFDRYGANEMVTSLRDDHGVKVMDFGQGTVSMNAPCKELDRMVVSKELAHGGHPVLRWAASNAVLRIDDCDNWVASKKKSTERIDPVVASIMAIGVALLQPGGSPTPTVMTITRTGGGPRPAPKPAPPSSPGPLFEAVVHSGPPPAPSGAPDAAAAPPPGDATTAVEEPPAGGDAAFEEWLDES